jgi:hypothetical protein
MLELKMKIIMAKILDPTHLELSQPLLAPKGGLIKISIPDDGEDDLLWRGAAKKHFMEAYDAEDAIYDEI